MFEIGNVAVLIIFAIGGLLFGALIMYLILDALRSRQDARLPRATQPLTDQTEAAAEKPPENDQERVEMVSLWREKTDGSLVLRINGKWHQSGKTLEPIERTRLERSMRDAAAVLGLYLVDSEPKKAEEKPAAVAMKPEAASMNAVPSEAPPRNLTIVEQVDEILQELLAETGMKDENIRLSEMPNKGVIVWVGKNYYEGIDAVPKDEVKKLIRQAVKRWEASR